MALVDRYAKSFKMTDRSVIERGPTYAPPIAGKDGGKGTVDVNLPCPRARKAYTAACTKGADFDKLRRTPANPATSLPKAPPEFRNNRNPQKKLQF